jgi:hypothetical protein
MAQTSPCGPKNTRSDVVARYRIGPKMCRSALAVPDASTACDGVRNVQVVITKAVLWHCHSGHSASPRHQTTRRRFRAPVATNRDRQRPSQVAAESAIAAKHSRQKCIANCLADSGRCGFERPRGSCGCGRHYRRRDRRSIKASRGLVAAQLHGWQEPERPVTTD